MAFNHFSLHLLVHLFIIYKMLSFRLKIFQDNFLNLIETVCF